MTHLPWKAAVWTLASFSLTLFARSACGRSESPLNTRWRPVTAQDRGPACKPGLPPTVAAATSGPRSLPPIERSAPMPRAAPEPVPRLPLIYERSPRQTDAEMTHAPLWAVRVWVEEPDGSRSGGSGVICELRNLAGQQVATVVTNHHVVEAAVHGAGHIRVEFPQGQPASSGQLLGSSPYHDIALLEAAAPPGATAVTLAAEDPVRQQTLVIYGYGGAGQGFLRQQGRLVDFARRSSQDARPPDFVIAGAQARSGDSGGPVLDGATGQLVGVLWGARPGETYAVCASVIRKVAARVLGRELQPSAGDEEDFASGPHGSGGLESDEPPGDSDELAGPSVGQNVNDCPRDPRLRPRPCPRPHPRPDPRPNPNPNPNPNPDPRPDLQPGAQMPAGNTPEKPQTCPCQPEALDKLRQSITALHAEITAMQARLQQLSAAGPGLTPPATEPGPLPDQSPLPKPNQDCPRPPGTEDPQAAPAALKKQIAQLEQELHALQTRLQQKLTVQILDAEGRVRQQTQTPWGGTLRLQLRPVK